jgi:voltage-gated potassium channel
MTKRRWADRPRSARRRVITLSLLRTAAVVAVLVTGYYLAPLDRTLDTGTGIRFSLSLLAIAVVVPLQVRAILAAENPWLRATQVVGIGVPVLLVSFASTYIVITNSVPDAFNVPLSRTDALYFTVTVFATVGFGDIAPQAEIARVFVTIQMLVGLTAVGVVAKVLFGAAQTSAHWRTHLPKHTDDEADE